MSRGLLAGLAALLLACTAAGCDRAAGSSKLAPDDPRREAVLRFWARFQEATSLRLRGEIEPAARAYQEALRIDPGHEDSLYYLGHCQRQLGRAAEARAAFARLVEGNPSSARGHLALGALLASSDPREPLDLEAAERHLRRAHEINKEETGAMVRIGELLILRERPDEAREWLEAAARTNPKSVEAAFLAGYLRWQRGDTASAARFFESARRATRADVPIRGVLSEGDRKPAVESAGRVPGPASPLQAPLRRTLLGAFSEPLRAPGASPAMAPVYRSLREALPKLRRKGG